MGHLLCEKLSRMALVNAPHVQNQAWTELTSRIHNAATRVRREPTDVTLVGAAKTVAPEALRTFVAAGLRVVGENYLQEGLAKQAALTDVPLRWHFIGGLQSNKAKAALQFSLIHSMDRRSLVTALDKAARETDRVQDILLQVNLAAEPSKGGCAVAELPALAALVAEADHLRLCGLMCLPPSSPIAENTRPCFRQLRELRDGLQREHPTCHELSMGMSHDFEIAIEEGATLVRIGAALFGAREGKRSGL